MSNKVWLITNDGIGGSLMTAQCAHYVKKAGKNPIIIVPARDEIFNGFKYLIDDQFECWQVSEDNIKWLLNYGKKAVGIDEGDELYVVYPDGLYLNPYAFDYKRYKTNPNLTRTTRVLTHKYNPVTDNEIYIGLATSTPEYLYPRIPELLECLTQALPDYIFHIPLLTTWANKTIDMGDFSKIKKNVMFYSDPEITTQIDILSSCCYGIFTDNGFSHISYHLGQPRLLIDYRYGFGRSSLPWVCRWRETTEDSIRFETCPQDIADVVRINLRIPQTTLIPRQVVLNNKHEDWSRELFFKY